VRFSIDLGSIIWKWSRYLCVYLAMRPDTTLMIDFLPALLGLAGITDTNRQRELNLVNSVTSMIGALTGSAIIDHVGRRKLMLFASCSAMIGMLIVGGLLSPAGEDNSMRANAGISFICTSFLTISIIIPSLSNPIVTEH